MLMDILGIVIGFASIMLLFSLLVSALVHGAQAALQLRFKNMQSVIKSFFDHIDVLDEPCKSKLANLLDGRSNTSLYATALPLDILGNRLKLSNIGKKELLDIVDAIVEMTPEHKQKIQQEVEEHFHTLEEIMSQRFKQWMHQLSIAIAFVICFVFKLNCFTVLDNLNQDSMYRQQVITMAEEFNQTAPPLEQANTTVYEDKLIALNFTLQPETWTGYYLSPNVNSLSNWLGIIFSAILISLGAPFWFNLLRDAISWRDKLSGRRA